MEYTQRDHDAIIAMCEQDHAEVRITYLPPQKTPRWARSYTAVARGTALGNGHYVRQGVNHA
jgi:hypothetical protein